MRPPAPPSAAPRPRWSRAASSPGFVLYCTVLYCTALYCTVLQVAGLIWSEIKQLWDVGLKEYISDMWNVVDFITNSLYVATIGLRTVAYFDVRKQNTVPRFCSFYSFSLAIIHMMNSFNISSRPHI